VWYVSIKTFLEVFQDNSLNKRLMDHYSREAWDATTVEEQQDQNNERGRGKRFTTSSHGKVSSGMLESVQSSPSWCLCA
jgi:hypothetical protein